VEYCQFHIILSIPHNIVMDLNNVMSTITPMASLGYRSYYQRWDLKI
jgi:hypothetical protein